jgi:Tol biopolymer transport system component
MLGRVLVAVSLVAALLAAAPATATFRGHNGLIAVQRMLGQDRDQPSVMAIEPGGGPEVTLATDAASPAWSPDGKRIAFKRGDDLYVADADGSNQHQISAPGSYWFDVAWSPNGRKLVGAYDFGGGGASGLWTMNADGTGLRPLSVRPEPSVFGTGGYEIAPAWSPNGKWIAFLFLHPVPRTRGGGMGVQSTELWLVRADGSHARRLTRTLVPEGRPSWSPDSTRIVYSRERKWSLEEASDSDIIVRAMRTGRTRVLVRGPADDRDPVWSPDGRTIAFTHAAEADPFSYERTIHLVDANGRHRRSIPQMEGAIVALDWQAVP